MKVVNYVFNRMDVILNKNDHGSYDPVCVVHSKNGDYTVRFNDATVTIMNDSVIVSIVEVEKPKKIREKKSKVVTIPDINEEKKVKTLRRTTTRKKKIASVDKKK